MIVLDTNGGPASKPPKRDITMTDNAENLLLEYLKRFQSGQDRIEHKLEEVISRLGNLEVSVASPRRDFGTPKKTQRPWASAWIA